VSLRIRGASKTPGIPFFAMTTSPTISLDGLELDQLEVEGGCKVRNARSLVIVFDNDHNTEETAERVARMYLQRYSRVLPKHPRICSFPNVKKLDENLHRRTISILVLHLALTTDPGTHLGNCWIWHQTR